MTEFRFIEEDRFTISGRGEAVTGRVPLALDGIRPEDVVGYVAVIDGRCYRVAGVETFVGPRTLRLGDPVGLLLGDEV